MLVTLIGGGIGGLATALSLDAAGVDVEVIEATRQIQPLGVGINLLPHAVRELTELGLGDALEATGIPTRELSYYDRFGSPIWTEPRGRGAGYRWPQISIHRGALQLLLLDAVRDRLGAGAVRTGLACEGFEQTGTQVRAELRNRHTGRRETLTTDVLIGADGIHSAVRAQLHPGEGRPIWNGIQMWRGVTEADPFLSGRTMVMAGSNLRAKFVAYPISRQSEAAGRSSVNWVAEVCLGGDRPREPEDWNRRGDIDEVLAHFGDWHFDWLDIPALIAGATAVFRYPMVDRDPLPHWGQGRVTLLGDAAHPMYPIGSNGASQAIIDARVLAWALARESDPVAALAVYESARREATGALVLSNREMGPERVLRIVAERAPGGFERIEDVMSRAELEAIAQRYKATAGFDVETLNARASWSLAPSRH